MNSLLRILQTRAQDQASEVVLEGCGLYLSSGDLLTEIETVAEVLRDKSAGTVALYAENCPMWAIVDMACQFNDVCLVPVPTFFSRGQLQHLLVSAGVELLIYQKSLAHNLSDIKTSEHCPLGLNGQFCFVEMEPQLTVERPVGTSKITFTSGSTGEPKGVCLSFEQCLNVAQALLEAVQLNAPKHLSLLPLSTLLENIAGIYMPLLARGSSVLLDPEELGLEGSSQISSKAMLDVIERVQPNTMILVPQLLDVLDAAMQQGWRSPTSLEFVAVGGARVPVEVVQRVSDMGLPVYEGYGLSECASVVSLNTPRNNRPGCSGKVLPHLSVTSRDDELQVSGNTFLGYLNQPETWNTDILPTGDIGSVDSDGYVKVEGRVKNILISSFGRNISPEWVEGELMAPGVFRQVIVLGDRRPHCVALILPVNPQLADRDIEASIDKANINLPEYAQIGHWLRLSKPLSDVEGLMTENGRLRRENIEEHFAHNIDKLYSKPFKFTSEPITL